MTVCWRAIRRFLIGLDASGFDTTPEGLSPVQSWCRSIDARRVRERRRGTGGKIMVYLRARTGRMRTRANIEILRNCIADFAREDLLLVVEFLTYELPGESKEAYLAAAAPKLIVDGTRICLELGSKLLKLPYPGNAGGLCGRITTRCAATSPGRCFRPASITRRSWAKSRSPCRTAPPGVIAGRSLWKDCISLDRSGHAGAG